MKRPVDSNCESEWITPTKTRRVHYESALVRAPGQQNNGPLPASSSQYVHRRIQQQAPTLSYGCFHQLGQSSRYLTPSSRPIQSPFDGHTHQRINRAERDVGNARDATLAPQIGAIGTSNPLARAVASKPPPGRRCSTAVVQKDLLATTNADRVVMRNGHVNGGIFPTKQRSSTSASTVGARNIVDQGHDKGKEVAESELESLEELEIELEQDDEDVGNGVYDGSDARLGAEGSMHAAGNGDGSDQVDRDGEELQEGENGHEEDEEDGSDQEEQDQDPTVARGVGNDRVVTPVARPDYSVHLGKLDSSARETPDVDKEHIGAPVESLPVLFRKMQTVP